MKVKKKLTVVIPRDLLSLLFFPYINSSSESAITTMPVIRP
jgi:hypothetical protein